MHRIGNKTREPRVANEGHKKETTARKGVIPADWRRIATIFGARTMQ
ncbi:MULTISPECIES: hypothetical protein [unclassified Neorhizobium]|nr:MULTISPECIES: hypothetical protein [unclassified Neorhizobium]MCJ9668541.1 hypothetical protein [Neorhizobium sp. SHOUNA12B]MCJ9744244.1 hypothetical protein [Neorhizobium sp. SHOUNA12A]